MEKWALQNRAEQLKRLRRTLTECQNELNKEVKIPLNVACSDVMKGVLTRSLDRVTAHGYARSHNQMREFSCENVVLPQISALNSAIARLINELDIIEQEPNALKPSIEYMAFTKNVFSVPTRNVRFPSMFFSINNERGYCAEIFICEESNIVFNLHAYQDNTQGSYTATDTVSAKSTDPGLYETWRKLDTAIAEYSNLL